MDSNRFNELHLFRLPALQELVSLDCQYLTSAEALARQCRLPVDEEASA